MDKNDRYKLYSESVGPGWWEILDQYIPQILAIDPDAELYIKEKYGVLRLRAISETHDWHDFLEIENSAKVMSSTICEQCGALGKLRPNRIWMQTLCDRCNKTHNQKIRELIAKETAAKWVSKKE